MKYAEGLFTWTDISVPDPMAGKNFYSSLFGWEPSDAVDDDGNYVYTMFNLEGASVAGLGPQPPEVAEHGIPPMWNSYISVDDLDGVIARWVGAGGAVLMAPMEVFEAGRMAFVADGEGAVVALWQAGEHPGGAVFNQPGAMTWNELNTRDSAAARNFYGNVLGWEFEEFGDGPSEYWLISVPAKKPGKPLSDDQYNGGILTMDASWPAETPPYWAVYFNTPDVDAAVARVAELGGSTVVPAFDSPAGRMAVVADSQGGTFSLIAPPQQG